MVGCIPRNDSISFVFGFECLAGTVTVSFKVEGQLHFLFLVSCKNVLRIGLA